MLGFFKIDLMKYSFLMFKAISFYAFIEYSTICINLYLKISLGLIKGALSGLRRFLATESTLKMMKNAFCFTSKALFVIKIFKFLSWPFGHVAKLLDKKDKVNFKFYDVIAWLINNCNTHVAHYLKKLRQSVNEIWSVNRM